MIKAIIFDLDGVITDTEPIHFEAWQAVLDPLGISFGEDEYRANYIGLNDRDFLDAVSRVHKHHFDEAEKDELIIDKVVNSIALLEHDVPVLPGVRDFVAAEAKERMFAICSGANRSEIEIILKHLKWEGLFNPIIAPDSVKKGKPDPEGYIRAIEGLVERSNGVCLPENIIAIEDSPKGIKAAKSAGIRCLAVGNSYQKDALKEADWVFDSLADVSVDQLLQ